MLSKMGQQGYLTLAHTLKFTLDALADMYDGRNGPWLDELEAEAMSFLNEEDANERDVRAVKQFFDDFRNQLASFKRRAERNDSRLINGPRN
jgi:hypothetical protein